MAKSPTHKTLEAARVAPGQRKEIIVDRNLRLRISRGTADDAPTIKSWSLQVRHHGRKKRITLGAFPAVGLADARVKASEAVTALAAGKDPTAEKREQRRRAKAGAGPISSLRDLLKEYERRVGANLSSWESQRGSIKHVFGRLLDRRLDDLRRHDIAAIAEDLAPTAPVHANRALRYLRTVLAWAVRRELLAVNPAVGIDRPAAERIRSRVLLDDELGALWSILNLPRDQQNAAPALTKAGATSKRKPADLVAYNQAAALMLLTAARRGEVEALAGAHIDAKASVWVVPPEVHKSRRGLRIPLLPAAVDLIETLKTDQAARLGRDLAAQDRLLPPLPNWSRWSVELRKRVNEKLSTDRRRSAAPADAGGVPWTRHDLRRTVASGLARLGTPPHVIEALLGHSHPTGSRLGSVYQVHSYEREIRAALEAWHGHLVSVAAGSPANVVPLKRG